MATVTTPPQTFTQAAPARDFCAVLDTPLLRFGSKAWTIGDACEGVLILGATGSGKTSGSGSHLARAYLRAGMGGLVLCAKPDERARWETYAQECGRAHQVIVMDDTLTERFNFLEYALHQQGKHQTLNLVSLFVQLAEAARRSKGGNAADPYWQDAMKELLSHSMDAIIAAEGSLKLVDLQRFMETLPMPTDERREGYCMRTLAKAYNDPVKKLPRHDMEVIQGYITQNMRYMSDKTRSGIISSFTSLAAPLIKGDLHTLFCTDTTLVPELAHEGAIIIVDLPTKVLEESGILAAHIMKYLFQKATERRTTDANTRPVFVWADECQFFLSDYDNEFQSTARSSRAATVYLTQNLSGIYSTIGGHHAEDAAEALLGNLRTKFFHLNDNHKTNLKAAEAIGKDLQHRANWSRSDGISRSANKGGSTQWGYSAGGSSSPQGGSSNSSWNRGSGSNWSEGYSTSDNRSQGASEQMDYRLQPSFFAEGLRNGGKRNQYKVDAVIVQSGARFDGTGQHWGICTFKQR